MASFMKKGKAAQQMHKKAEAETEAKKQASENQVNRFWMPNDSERQITFLDGEVDADGVLNANSFWEHQLKLGGHWRNWYPCTQLEEECPICEGGDNASLVTIFTIIDHEPFTSKKTGKTYQNERKLLAVKREVYKRLQKIAAKRGGLAGITFDVSRGGDKSPGSGELFEFVEKRTTAEIAKAYNLKADDVKPFDYDKVIVYNNAKKLREMGFGAEGGAGGKAIGSADGDALSGGGSKGQVEDYDDEV